MKLFVPVFFVATFVAGCIHAAMPMPLVRNQFTTNAGPSFSGSPSWTGNHSFLGSTNFFSGDITFNQGLYFGPGASIIGSALTLEPNRLIAATVTTTNLVVQGSAHGDFSGATNIPIAGVTGTGLFLTNNETRSVSFNGSIAPNGNILWTNDNAGIVKTAGQRLQFADDYGFQFSSAGLVYVPIGGVSISTGYGAGLAVGSDVIFSTGASIAGVGITNSIIHAGGLTVTGSPITRSLDLTANTNLWDDIVFEPTALNPVGLSDAATLVSNSGQSGDQMALTFSANKVMFISAQLGHIWVAGTTVYPHLHLEPQSNLAITNVWKVSYSISDIGGTFGASTLVTNQITIPVGSQWKHLLYNVPTNGLSMSGKTGPSTIIRLKYELLSTTETMHVVSFDVHYRYGGSPVVFNP